MPKISRNASCIITEALSLLTTVGLVVLGIFLPTLLRGALDFFAKESYLFTPTLVISYIAIVVAIAALVTLFFILRRVRAGAVFTAKNVAAIRFISWLCFAETAAFFSLGFYYVTMFAVAFVFGFLGLVVRVFKNMVEEAVAIKEENDYTI